MMLENARRDTAFLAEGCARFARSTGVGEGVLEGPAAHRDLAVVSVSNEKTGRAEPSAGRCLLDWKRIIAPGANATPARPGRRNAASRAHFCTIFSTRLL
jgi:hypothetical protein